MEFIFPNVLEPRMKRSSPCHPSICSGETAAGGGDIPPEPQCRTRRSTPSGHKSNSTDQVLESQKTRLIPMKYSVLIYGFESVVTPKKYAFHLVKDSKKCSGLKTTGLLIWVI
jgi:hypothetical protein